MFRSLNLRVAVAINFKRMDLPAMRELSIQSLANQLPTILSRTMNFYVTFRVNITKLSRWFFDHSIIVNT